MSHKLLISYDVKEYRLEDYYRFVMGEFLPRLQMLGLAMTEGWQTIHGNYPSRLLVFEARNSKSLHKALDSDVWDSVETKLKEFIVHYEKRVVKAKPNFQFFIPQYRGENEN